MADKFEFTAKEREETLALIDHLRTTVGNIVPVRRRGKTEGQTDEIIGE